MAGVNTTATHKFVIVLNEKSPIGKLLSATGQIAMSLYTEASHEQRTAMSFVPFIGTANDSLISLSTCSFVVLAGTGNQLQTLYTTAYKQGLLTAIFTSTMSYSGIEEDLIKKTATTPLEHVEPYGVGLFGQVEELAPLTKKFSVFK